MNKRMEQMCYEMTNCYLNMACKGTSEKIEALNEEATLMNKRFRMTNESQYNLPGFMGKPHFVLIDMDKK